MCLIFVSKMICIPAEPRSCLMCLAVLWIDIEENHKILMQIYGDTTY